MKKIQKTNAARLLDRAKVPYDLIPYEVDESDLSAGHLAATIGEDINQVFKTLVLFGEKTKHFVCVIPGDHEVDLKKAAKLSGNKKVDLIAMKDLLATTGYIRGGCSPLGMKRKYRTFIDSTAEKFEKIFISAGLRGEQIELAPADLVKAADAVLCDLVLEG